MMNIHKPFSFGVLIFVACVLKISAANHNASSELSEPPPYISLLATKRIGVCSKSDVIENYISSCNQSSIRIFSETDSFPEDISMKAYLKVKKQNLMLMEELINRAVHNSTVPVHQPRFGFDLLSTVLAIYAKVCPAVPASFLQTVHHLFSYIHWKTASNRKEYLSKPDQKWIATRINNCTLRANLPKFLTDTCKETVLTLNNCTTFVCTDSDNEFRIMRTDPIVDVVFKSMEIVQAICFPYFSESYRMFHSFHLAIMDTFTDDIKTRWVTQREEMSYWKRLLGTNFEDHLINLERCNVGIISNAKFHYRISRSSLPARLRMAGAVRKL